MGRPPTRRRDRLRAETSAEIKAIALDHLTAKGPEAVSLRGIARDMGMTAGAIYSYFDTRDDLITALISDSYASLADEMEAACTRNPEDDPAARVLAVTTAYREWAITHPEEFRLIYGDPVSGYEPPESGPVRDAEDRACAVLLRLVASGWPMPEHPLAQPFDWPDFGSGYAERVRELFPELEPATVALALRMWGRMHGQVALEIYGHLGTQLKDPAKLYRAEMLDLTRTLGMSAMSSASA
ncbi:TetR/AcrR family transcriptional regulator [Actinosynnema sp. NPDC053489]|uniref:TetR/AcrR family transcriptional regulator n=1 Tax=Actinosynnema sp. NPDC053489 TaxID=3363916 RepID=UPI0037C93525